MSDNSLRVGGSEVELVYKDPFGLWLRKKGGLAEIQPTMRMRIGTCLESLILDAYQEVTGYALDPHQPVRFDPVRPYMRTHYDALCVGQRRGVDAKFTSFDQREMWADDIPDRILLQCHYYLASSDYDYWDVAVLQGDRFEIRTVERDPEVEDSILERVQEFWHRYLVGDERPPMSASEACRAWLQRTFPRETAPVREATEDEISLLNYYAQLRADQDELQDERDKLESVLKQRLGDDAGMNFEGGHFTWRRSKDAQIMDWQSLAITLERFVTDREQLAQIKADHTRTREGTRRIHFSHPLRREASHAA